MNNSILSFFHPAEQTPPSEAMAKLDINFPSRIVPHDQPFQVLSDITERDIPLDYKASIYAKQLAEATECLLCTSDILESAFGKYKNYMSAHSMAGMTGLVLCIAAFTSSLEAHELKEALEQTTTQDVHTWIHDHVGPTLLKKRRDAFSE